MRSLMRRGPWVVAIGGTGKFALNMARFNDYLPPPEAPDTEDKEKKKKK
jgi:hypothetical protein